MRLNITLMFLTLFFMSAIPPYTYALNPKAKDYKQIMVAKKGGDYKTISAALDAIKDASKTKRYVIKVMPGNYEESVDLKPYVDLIGSGQENTKVTSSEYYTVWGENNSSIENIWIDNTKGIRSKRFDPSAIIVKGKNITINNVKVTISDPIPPISQAFGIQTFGPASKPVISNCTVYARGTNQRAFIGIGGAGRGNGGSPTITNCEITVDTSGATKSFWNVGIRARKGNATIKNSKIKVIGADYNQGIEGAKLVQDSRIEVIATSNTVSNIGVEYATVTDSEIIIEGQASQTNCAVSRHSKIERSLIEGPVCDKKSEIINSRNGKNKPIPNQ